ncbi:hypothetical protein [Actinophytocola xanthii]|uniref:Uncharacterized protein n=1 Tax=Actinophytocola xanthii TaxID=1912961 RepID=A0A1Q8CQC9_9PSEU|nr:hypothetical protein [Actinophytocola xanthii]OLF16563.1 hypothetical protein BU204_16030 [Actinophytocola xanthii]
MNPILLIYLFFFLSLAFAFVGYRWVPPTHLAVSITLVVVLGLTANWNIGFQLLLLLLPGMSIVSARLWASRDDAARS